MCEFISLVTFFFISSYRCLLSCVCQSGSVDVAWVPLCPSSTCKHISWQQYLGNVFLNLKKKNVHLCLHISRLPLYSGYVCRLFLAISLSLRLLRTQTDTITTSIVSQRELTGSERTRGYIRCGCNCIFSSHFQFYLLPLHFVLSTVSNYARLMAETSSESEKILRISLQEWIII